MRIRTYGYLANRHRRRKLALCRRFLGVGEPSAKEFQADAPEPEAAKIEPDAADSEPEVRRCPACRVGRLRMIETFERSPRCRDHLSLPSHDVIPFADSS